MNNRQVLHQPLHLILNSYFNPYLTNRKLLLYGGSDVQGFTDLSGSFPGVSMLLSLY